MPAPHASPRGGPLASPAAGGPSPLLQAQQASAAAAAAAASAILSPSSSASSSGGSSRPRVEFQVIILATSAGSSLFPLTREASEALGADATSPAGASNSGTGTAANAPPGGAADISAATESIGRSQLLVANRPLLAYQLDMVHKAGFPQVIVITRDSMRRGVTRIVEEWRAARGGSGATASQAGGASLAAPGSVLGELQASTPTAASASSSSLLDVDLVCLENYRGTADALRQVSEKIYTDFFCLSGDLVSNVQFQNLADLHRAQDAGVVLCVQNAQDAAAMSAGGSGAGGAAGTPAAAAADKERRKKEEEAAAAGVDAQYLGIDSSNGRLLIFQSAADVEESLSIDKRLLQRHPHLTLHTHLRDCHLYVFSYWVLLFLHTKPSIVSIRSELLPCLVAGQYKEKYAEWRGYGKNSAQVAALRMSHAPRKAFESVLAGAAGGARANNQPSSSSSQLPQPTLNRDFSAMDAGNNGASNQGAGVNLRASASMNSIPEGGAGLGALGSAGRFGLRAEPQESFRLFVYTCPSSTFAARASSVSAYKQLNHDLSQDREYTYMPWPAISSDNAAPLVAKSHPPQSVAVNNFSVLGDGVTFAGEGTTVKRTCVARNCRIGARVKLQGCVIMEGVIIEDGCNLTDCIVGANATIGKGSTLKDCKVGPQFRVEAATEAKNEILCEDD